MGLYNASSLKGLLLKKETIDDGDKTSYSFFLDSLCLMKKEYKGNFFLINSLYINGKDCDIVFNRDIYNKIIDSIFNNKILLLDEKLPIIKSILTTKDTLIKDDKDKLLKYDSDVELTVPAKLYHYGSLDMYFSEAFKISLDKLYDNFVLRINDLSSFKNNEEIYSALYDLQSGIVDDSFSNINLSHSDSTFINYVFNFFREECNPKSRILLKDDVVSIAKEYFEDSQRILTCVERDINSIKSIYEASRDKFKHIDLSDYMMKILTSNYDIKKVFNSVIIDRLQTLDTLCENQMIKVFIKLDAIKGWYEQTETILRNILNHNNLVIK